MLSKHSILSSVLAVAITCSASLPLNAGNIILTGHDDDFHRSAAALAQIQAFVTLAKNGSVLPVLVFDAGAELTTALTTLGIVFVNVNPNTASSVTDSLFNIANYSAFLVASDSSCGGCDNSAAGEANIASHSTAIQAFLNAGGGIVGFAGGSSANYYAFAPQSATSVGGAPSSGYSATGLFGIGAVNGDATHNLFYDPGTHGESVFYQVAEINSAGNGTILGPTAATTLVCFNCSTSGGIIVGSAPEPATIGIVGAALLGLAWRRRSMMAKRS